MPDAPPPLVAILAALTPDVTAELRAGAKQRRLHLTRQWGSRPPAIAARVRRLDAGMRALADLARLHLGAGHAGHPPRGRRGA